MNLRTLIGSLGLASLALSSVVWSHEGTRPRVDPDQIEPGGLYVEIRHPHVVRSDLAFTVTVSVDNLLGEDEMRLTGVRYGMPRPLSTTMRGTDHRLPSKRRAYRRYLAIEQRLDAAARSGSRGEIEGVLEQRIRTLEQLKRDVFVDRQSFSASAAEGEQLTLDIEITVEQNGTPRLIRRSVSIPIRPPLPRGGPPAVLQDYDLATGVFSEPSSSRDRSGGVEDSWFAGDQHLHSTYSLDAFIFESTSENVGDYAAAADAIGLDWITVTDHSNVDINLFGQSWYTPAQYMAGVAEAAEYSDTHDFLAQNGQEMAADKTPILGIPSHLLAYPSSVDSTGFLANPCSGYIANVAYCEDQQVIIDRINDAGGMGFIAHPTDDSTLYSAWKFDKGAVGWAGMEIWTSKSGNVAERDVTARQAWHQLLTGVRRPRDGALFERPEFPTKFPVAIGNSDAHAPGSIGATFTYAQMPAVTRANVSDALLAGRAVASNGPLLFASINDAGLGDVATDIGASTPANITLHTTSEFGPVGDYGFRIFVDGVLRGEVPPSGSTEFSTTIGVTGLELRPPDKFVTVQVGSIDGNHHAFTNPIWLSFPLCRGDVNDDFVVDGVDFLRVILNLGPCDECPEDVLPDGVVDFRDALEVLANFGTCQPDS